MYLFIYCVYIVCLSMIYTCSSQKGVLDPGSGFKLPSVGAQNPTQVLGRAANVLAKSSLQPVLYVLLHHNIISIEMSIWFADISHVLCTHLGLNIC